VGPTFNRLHATKSEREAVRGGSIMTDAQQLPTDGVAELTSPATLTELRAAARLLRAFSKHT